MIGCRVSRLTLSEAWLTTRRDEIGMISSTATSLLAFNVPPVEHQVDDGVGQAGQRRQFHRTVELDQVDMDALGGEMLARRLDVLGSDLEAGALAHRVLVVEAFRHGDHHPAPGDLQVERRIEALPAMLDQHVLAGHAEVGGAVLDIGRHVGGADDDDAHIGPVGADDQLARGFRVLVRHDPCGRQQRQGFVEDASLRQGDGDGRHDGACRNGENGILAEARGSPGRRRDDLGVVTGCGRRRRRPSARPCGGS